MKPLKLPTIFFIITLLVLLVFTRFVNLGWGLPYPMHPDERNMLISITQLKCDTKNWEDCLHPHFFAYGQLPMYLAFFLTKTVYFFQGDIDSPIGYEDATIALRLISAVLAVLTGIILYHSLALLSRSWLKKGKQILPIRSILYEKIIMLLGLVVVFVPALIQFAHFGTTESLLMFSYTAITWLSLLFLAKKINPMKFAVSAGIVTGIALASKVSALAFGIVPIAALLLRIPFIQQLKKFRLKRPTRLELQKFVVMLGDHIGSVIIYGSVSLLLGLLLSPYNLIQFDQFYSSMNYESGVGVGTMLVFYTRSFFETAPIFFHVSRVFPFVLGLPLFSIFMLGFIFLPWNKKEFLFLRFVFLVNFLSQAFFYAKWARFIAPVYPIMVLIATVFLVQLYFFIRTRLNNTQYGFFATKLIFAVLVLITIIPGMAFLSVYVKPDVRYVASRWIYDSIPEGSVLLAETANVVDVPIAPPNSMWETKNYQYISFPFYDVDADPTVQERLKEDLARADYVIVNSRRVFKNHTCEAPKERRYKPALSIDQTIPVPAFNPLSDQEERCRKLRQMYPVLNQYYRELFSDKGSFTMVAEFAQYPEISLFNKTLIEFPDENAEETWAVFDHPVIRIYKRNTSSQK